MSSVESASAKPGTDLDFRPLSLLVGMAYFMEQLDATIIAPAIPDMAEALGVEPLRLNLTMTVYLLMVVVCVPISGALADRFGTRRVFRASVVIFTLSSLLCGFASSLESLLLWRALQGASGAMMIPTGRIAIVRSVASGHLVVALAWMITPAMIGPLLGPPLGGFLVTHLSWHWIFWINLPFGLLGFYLAGRYVPQVYAPQRIPLDVPGWLLLSVGLAALVFGLEISTRAEVPLWQKITCLVTVPVSLVAYAAHSRRCSHPLLDFRLLSTGTFRVSFVSGTLVRVGYLALPFLLPLALQIGMDFSALDSGLVLLGSALAAIIMKTWTALILRRFGFRDVIFWNGFLCAAGLALCALIRPGWGFWAVLLMLMLGGIARSVQFNAVAAIAYADLPARDVGAATSLNTTFQQLAGTLGISLSVWVLGFSSMLRGSAEPGMEDFSVVFVILALIALAAVPMSRGLKPDSGAHLSGHRVRREPN